MWITSVAVFILKDRAKYGHVEHYKQPFRKEDVVLHDFRFHTLPLRGELML